MSPISGSSFSASYSGRLRIGTSSANGGSYQLRVHATYWPLYVETTSTSNTTSAIRVRNTASGGGGILAEGGAHGVYGYATASTARGLYGRAASTTGFNYGVYGSSSSRNGRGVQSPL